MDITRTFRNNEVHFKRSNNLSLGAKDFLLKTSIKGKVRSSFLIPKSRELNLINIPTLVISFSTHTPFELRDRLM
jgi:hypothetical protein